jgi:uncharacterized protein
MESKSARAKQDRLRSWIAAHRPLVVAFSGGVDSAFLLATARLVLGDEVLAVTAQGLIHPAVQTAAAREMAGRIGAAQVCFEDDLLSCEAFARNRSDRCYVCKHRLFTQMRGIADRHGIAHLVHGDNADDSHDYRPGRRAALELNVLAPLAECGLDKAEIRHLSRRMGLGTWNQPAQSCLATRIAYGVPIDASRLRQVEAAETELARLGVDGGRVRHHGDTARIEVAPAHLATLVSNSVRADLVRFFRGLGFAHVALDLEGYVSGSLNRGLG